MVTWSRINDDGTEELIKSFDTFDQAVQYFQNQKDPEEPEKPENGCWNCRNYDWKHEACTLRWNNMDESYYNPDIDDREYTDCCDDHDEDPDVDPADWFEYRGNEP